MKGIENVGRLAGKTILVTGASSGFGRGIALACAAEGAAVALVARREEKLREVAALVEQQGVRAAVCAADVGDEAQIMAAVESAVAQLGPLDVVVNNAGMNVAARSIVDTSSAEWRELLEVNLTSAYIFTRAVLPAMLERGHGTIINVASRAAAIPSLMAGVAYSTSKLGMDALTQVTNEEGNPHGVRATLICPGEGDTPLLDRRPAPPPLEKRVNMLQPEDMGETVVLVASLPPRVTIERIDIKPTQQ